MSDENTDFAPVEPTPPAAQPAMPTPVAPPYAAPAAGPYAAGVPPQAPPLAQPGYYLPPTQPPYPEQTVPGGYPAQYAYAPVPPRGLSIASMICGIGSIVFLAYGFGLFPAIAAIITGTMARKRQPYARGFWLSGLIMGYIGLGIAVLWIIGLIVLLIVIGTHGGFSSTSDSDYGLSAH